MSQTTLSRNESGLAAITVTLIILGIVTLITVGFASLMRREQRQALDQQLSTQAFYAAESGVNAARDYIDSSINSVDIATITDCDDTEDVLGAIPLNDSASVSCVLLDPTPDSLQANLSTNKSWVIPVQTESGDPISKLEISWQMPDSTRFAEPDWEAGNLLVPQSEWGTDRTGMLRLMLMPNSTNRNTLITDTYQAFLYPNADSGNSVEVDITPPDQGKILNGNCDTSRKPYYCRVYLTGLNSNAYTLRLRGVYNPSTVLVRALDDGDSPMSVKNGQAKIDATGKAADVVRRIQVNVPIQPNDFLFPEYALETFTTLCKRFYVWPGGAQGDLSSATAPNITLSQTEQDALNQACAI